MAREHKLKKASLGTGFMIGIAIIYLLFGLAMLFVPQFHERYIIYIAGLLFLICGVIMIVKYFMAASYNDLGNYGFSGGVLCILLGICLLDHIIIGDQRYVSFREQGLLDEYPV